MECGGTESCVIPITLADIVRGRLSIRFASALGAYVAIWV